MTLTAAEQRELFEMVKEIHHHLGLDGSKIISMKDIREQAKRDVLKWNEKQAIKEHVSETT